MKNAIGDQRGDFCYFFKYQEKKVFKIFFYIVVGCYRCVVCFLLLADEWSGGWMDEKKNSRKGKRGENGLHMWGKKKRNMKIKCSFFLLAFSVNVCWILRKFKGWKIENSRFYFFFSLVSTITSIYFLCVFLFRPLQQTK